MERKHAFVPKEWYHIYNRGVDKMNIFLDKSDYRRFLELLYLTNSSNAVDIQKLLREGRTFTELLEHRREAELVSIGAFCLIPNHFHLLASPNDENGISRFMQKLTTGYAMYFNKRNKRVGPLFQGRFKSTHAETDNHLNYLFSYIHLNPIKLKEPLWKELSRDMLKRNIRYAFSYPYSSVSKYIGKQSTTSKILTEGDIPWRFSSTEECVKELLSWFESFK